AQPARAHRLQVPLLDREPLEVLAQGVAGQLLGSAPIDDGEALLDAGERGRHVAAGALIGERGGGIRCSQAELPPSLGVAGPTGESKASQTHVRIVPLCRAAVQQPELLTSFLLYTARMLRRLQVRPIDATRPEVMKRRKKTASAIGARTEIMMPTAI